MEQDLIFIKDKDQNEIIRIALNGDLFWKGRKVETDKEYVNACTEMIRLATKRLFG